MSHDDARADARRDPGPQARSCKGDLTELRAFEPAFDSSTARKHLSKADSIPLRPRRTLPYGTPEQVRDETRCLLDEIGRNGGYIASPAHAIPADAQPENIAAMIQVLQNQ